MAPVATGRGRMQFADVALGKPFQPPALVLDVLHLQIQEWTMGTCCCDGRRFTKHSTRKPEMAVIAKAKISERKIFVLIL